VAMIHLFLLLFALQETELEACKRLAPKYTAETEVVLPDDSRCDLLSERYAIEVDWAEKWKEAPAQAVLYAVWTGKEPAILLLTKGKQDEKIHLLRAALVCERLKIKMFVEGSP